jgi:Putative zinc ribbon domain
MFRPKGPYCQSCGMPLSRDEKGGGTEADGRTSTEYCSHCYLGGAFTDPSLTAEQMMERVRGKLRERHIPGLLANVIVKDIPSLGRWAKR